MRSNQWIVRNFYLIAYLPKGVRLTVYGGDSADLPGDVLHAYLDKIASGEISLGRRTSTASTTSARRTPTWSTTAHSASLSFSSIHLTASEPLQPANLAARY
jgi:hypothetical protein